MASQMAKEIVGGAENSGIPFSNRSAGLHTPQTGVAGFCTDSLLKMGLEQQS
jgi:hypothetical protein